MSHLSRRDFLAGPASAALAASPAVAAMGPNDKFDLVFNNTTAKALGLTIPESFLVRVTEMIE